MRKSGFYPNLALTNVLRNGQFYLPYFLTCVATIAMFYILSFLTYNDMIDTMPGTESLQVILNLGCIVVGLFSVVIISYTNGFIMKRRRRELGLYNILGMEKRHIARLLCCESLLMGGASILCGLGVGILLSKLILLLLLKLLHFTVKMGFSVSITGIIVTAILFAVIFTVILLKNLFQIRLAKPVELLHSNAMGEREPKTKWIVAVLGLLTLGGGYVIANVVKSPLQALMLFFVAVILVIIGTYFLFTAGSVAFLKRLRANKNYYYKAKHFTAVSGLLYRMKQNAVGLASICILSTMVLVTVSTTVCLYLGTEQSLKARAPYDITVASDLTEDSPTTKETLKQIKGIVTKSGRKITALQAYTCLQFTAQQKGNELILDPNSSDASADSYQVLFFLTAADYNRLTGSSVSLKEHEMLCYSIGEALPDQFTLGNLDFTIAKRLKEPPMKNAAAAFSNNVQYLVVSDENVLHKLFQIQKKAYTDWPSAIQYEVDFNLDGTDQEKIDCYQTITSRNFSGSSSCRQELSEEFYTVYGGFLFLGLFLGLLFLIATVLIIYYKQISEGYEDQRRFEIMQKVGMTEKEVRRSVQSQILLVFFLPLLMAGIHILAAFNMITRLLAVFALTDVQLFALCTVGTLVLFGSIYALVYWATARTYYKIVRAHK